MERNRTNEKPGAMRDLHVWMKQFISQSGVETLVHDEFGGFIGYTMQAQVLRRDGQIAVSVEQLIHEEEKYFFKSGMEESGISIESEDIMLLSFGDPRDDLTEAYLVTDINAARKGSEKTVFYPLEDYEVEMLCVSLGVEGYWASEE